MFLTRTLNPAIRKAMNREARTRQFLESNKTFKDVLILVLLRGKKSVLPGLQSQMKPGKENDR